MFPVLEIEGLSKTYRSSDSVFCLKADALSVGLGQTWGIIGPSGCGKSTLLEMLALLATDGMLVKRPLAIGDDFVLVGFKEAEWVEKLK